MKPTFKIADLLLNSRHALGGMLVLCFVSVAIGQESGTSQSHTLKPTPKTVAWGYHDAQAAPKTVAADYCNAQ